MTKQLEALIARAKERSEQLSELEGADVAEQLFTSTIELENKDPFPFTRSISDFAFSTRGTIDALIAALEQRSIAELEARLAVPEPFGFVTKMCAEHMHDNDHDENHWMWSISAVVIGCDPKLKHEVPVYLHPAPSKQEASPLAVKLPLAAEDVLAERQRQVSAEGWTPHHDDEHRNGEMAAAAACYALHTYARAWTFASDPGAYQSDDESSDWPWSPEWWKPTSPRRDLVKAGALIQAEIERMDRAAGGTEEGE